MAYNKYDSDKQVSFMDGIPVKISEQYKPPKKITLPGAIINKLNAETVLPEYDFTLERSVMDKMSRWRDLRQSQREARQERVAAERQERAVSEPAAVSEDKPTPLPSLPERAVSPPSSKPYSMLMPVPINASTLSQSTDYSKSFNISDFEQDNASPFDNEELKTINDMEVLADVLQPVVVSDKNENNTDQKKSHPPRLNGFNTQYHFNSSLWTNNFNQVPGAVYPSQYQAPIPTLPREPPRNSPIQSFVVQRLDVGGQNSKSVPDIVQQLELELRDKREAETRRNREQPQRPASIGPAELSRRSVSTSEPTQQSVSLKPSSTLPNPYSQLTGACQQLTHRLAEMGFPLPRVARAAQLFGDDETRIVEFLVQVQRLEEMNYPSDRAEKALTANNYKETETVEYLKNVGQLLDLGFSENEVEQALLKCGSDRDKALDLLIS